MAKFLYSIEIETDTQEHADQVIQERVFFEEELIDADGNTFDYRIDLEEQ